MFRIPILFVLEWKLEFVIFCICWSLKACLIFLPTVRKTVLLSGELRAGILTRHWTEEFLTAVTASVQLELNRFPCVTELVLQEYATPLTDQDTLGSGNQPTARHWNSVWAPSVLVWFPPTIPTLPRSGKEQSRIISSNTHSALITMDLRVCFNDGRACRETWPTLIKK